VAQRLDAVVRRLADRHAGEVTATYRAALHGFSVRMSEQRAKRLAAEPDVDYVEQDSTVRFTTTQTPTSSWGLDRVDRRPLLMDNLYRYDNNASNVAVYVLDTGIRTSHRNFGGRAHYGRDTVSEDNVPDDCNGHATHAAGTIGGGSYSVAMSARP
jgi:subtilisin family serine protease